MPEPTIVTCFPLSDQQFETIAAAGESHGFRTIRSDQEHIAEDIFRANVFCGHAKVAVDWAKVVQQNQLRWIQSSAAGLDHCLTPEVIQSDITVTGCSALFSPQVAEQTLSLLMGLIRRLPVFFHAQQFREYLRRPTDNLEGKHVTILGFGGNGQQIARCLRPLAGRIMATDCFPDSYQHLIDDTVDQVISPNQLDTLLPVTDILIVTLPLSEKNEKLLSFDQLRQLKGGAYLINVGRGSVVDTEGLIASLSTGHLGGAGIDVVDPEPLPQDSPLWEMDNVIITPHVGAQSPRRVPVTVELFCENLKRHILQQPLLNLVDKQLGFPLPANRIDHVDCGWKPSSHSQG